MEQTTTTTATAQRPGFLTTLCVLSYIGSGLWALLSLIGIFASGWIMSFFMGSAMQNIDTTGMSAEDAAAVESMATAGGGMMGMLSSYIIVVFIVSLILAALSLFGVVKMWQLKKSGFWIYSIVNGIMVILGFIGGGVLGAIIGLAFIVMYGLNLKHMTK